MLVNGFEFLFDVTQYPARWHCGHWAPLIGWTYIISDLLIFIAYIGVPISIMYYYKEMNTIRLGYIAYLFAAFIFLCGTTHLIDAIIFWKPIYNFAMLILLLAGLVSLGTLIVIIVKLPTTINFIKDKRSANELRLELEKTQVEESKKFAEALREKNNELENANRAKDRFLASMSHELRTPLNAIIGFTGTLLMKLPGPLNAEQEKQLMIIKTSSKHLLSLISDLLDVAKIESGNFELHCEELNCQQIINEVTASLMPIAHEKSIRLKILLPEQPIKIWGDKRALLQILINLVNNAIKATQRGEVIIELKTLPSRTNEGVIINVIDTGLGIPHEEQNKLFQAFKQIESTQDQHGTTGLGLYISKKLAELSNFTLAFESEPGEGSKFSITIDHRLP